MREILNDIHSALNPTEVLRVIYPKSVREIQDAVRNAKKEGLTLSVSSGRHAMGGQQFGENTLHLSMTQFNQVLHLDSKLGLLEVEAGIEWHQIASYLEGQSVWGFTQKQTGADRLSIGGALSANIHGRGLKLCPFIQDIEAFHLVDAEGGIHECSRVANPELFSLAIGGYGLFGVITHVKLRLSHRQRVQRCVSIERVQDLTSLFKQRIEAGHLYGDFQFMTDETDPAFMEKGIFATYFPMQTESNVTPVIEISPEQWRKLYALGHFDKKEAFKVYSNFYLSSSGQNYWSDTHQMSIYLDGYHKTIAEDSSEMISELYVPRSCLADFMAAVKNDFLSQKTNLFYGTIRLIEKDDESFLAWARESYACIIFNLHVEHTVSGIKKAQKEFQKLIDRALSYGGGYYLTYHRWASKEQVLSAYPQFPQFLKLKTQYDPQERFQSTWYRHYKELFD